jgi:transposase
MNATESRIIELHNVGMSVSEISSRFGKSYSNRVVAGIIAKSEMTIETELFLVIPSKINYEFKLIRDYGNK